MQDFGTSQAFGRQLHSHTKIELMSDGLGMVAACFSALKDRCMGLMMTTPLF